MEGTIRAWANDFLEEMSTGTYENRTFNGHCSRCGGCCSAFLPLFKEDITKIKKYLLVHDIKPEHNSTHDTIDMLCPFLSNDKLCLIYDVRPLICRVFKCDTDPDQIKPKYKKIFAKKKATHKNMWSVFFNDNRANELWQIMLLKRYGPIALYL